MTTQALSGRTTGPAPADARHAVIEDPGSGVRTAGRRATDEVRKGGPHRRGSEFAEWVLAGRPAGGVGRRPPNLDTGSAAMGAGERLRAPR